MLVVDASAAIRACAGDGFAIFGQEELCAPPLMWSEFRSGVHAAVWHRHVTRAAAEATLDGLERSRIRQRSHRGLGREAWRIADLLGWASTYDAEYLALASLLGCRVVTRDARMRRGADRLGFVVTPAEL